MGKEIKQIFSPEVAAIVGQKLMRTICFKYSKLVEMCKQ